MRRITEKDFRKTLASALDRVSETREPVIITRDLGKPTAVLLSLEEFASWKETLHLLRSPTNAARLVDAVAEFVAGGGTERKLAE